MGAKGIFVEAAGLRDAAHQYWIKLYSENGLGNIVLYKSNGYYWADFESANYNLDLEEGAIFCKGNISFGNGHSLSSVLTCYDQEFITHITRKNRKSHEVTCKAPKKF